MSNLENTNINVKEIKSELSDLIGYMENNYTNREHWTVDGEKVLKGLYRLSELIYDKEIKEALIQYKDEELLFQTLNQTYLKSLQYLQIT